MASKPCSSPSSSPETSRIDPILRNALRYTISAKEYQALHEYVSKHSPQALRKRAPPPVRFESISRVGDSHNAAAIRASLRVFVASQVGLQVWDFITTRLLARKETQRFVRIMTPGVNPTDTVQGQKQDIDSSFAQFTAIGIAFPHTAPTSVEELNGLAKRVLRMTLFITMAIGTSWGSICLFANFLPRNFLPTQRWFLGGFLGGLWAFLDRKGGRSNFMYSVRLSIDSSWKVGKKRGWWKGVRGGDLGLLVAGLMIVNAVYEKDQMAVEGSLIRKGMEILRGDGKIDEREGKMEEEMKRKEQ
ncbi:MAG: hypothetical protein Q9219_001641 [cf. Caloplaca sp. 3 TL-2023]